MPERQSACLPAAAEPRARCGSRLMRLVCESRDELDQLLGEHVIVGWRMLARRADYRIFSAGLT